ncbi:hypothetical protein MHPYR_60136 [uncultured Mycobacterium sp.]|uniref:Uncharacterized protein n=1 Tax=uncultured Mycobacterium sp. TaxID=171292 RepID=A0A1Y5PRV0_9MYCO|nr:hypothetical protein MHPYR_60136 [uncultured Mycobacterium sp.]
MDDEAAVQAVGIPAVGKGTDPAADIPGVADTPVAAADRRAAGSHLAGHRDSARRQPGASSCEYLLPAR